MQVCCGLTDLILIKLKLRSFKSSEHINDKNDGPFLGFGYLNLLH